MLQQALQEFCDSLNRYHQLHSAVNAEPLATVITEPKPGLIMHGIPPAWLKDYCSLCVVDHTTPPVAICQLESVDLLGLYVLQLEHFTGWLELQWRVDNDAHLQGHELELDNSILWMMFKSFIFIEQPKKGPYQENDLLKPLQTTEKHRLGADPKRPEVLNKFLVVIKKYILLYLEHAETCQQKFSQIAAPTAQEIAATNTRKYKFCQLLSTLALQLRLVANAYWPTCELTKAVRELSEYSLTSQTFLPALANEDSFKPTLVTISIISQHEASGEYDTDILIRTPQFLSLFTTNQFCFLSELRGVLVDGKTTSRKLQSQLETFLDQHVTDLKSTVELLNATHATVIAADQIDALQLQQRWIRHIEQKVLRYLQLAMTAQLQSGGKSKLTHLFDVFLITGAHQSPQSKLVLNIITKYLAPEQAWRMVYLLVMLCVLSSLNLDDKRFLAQRTKRLIALDRINYQEILTHLLATLKTVAYTPAKDDFTVTLKRFGVTTNLLLLTSFLASSYKLCILPIFTLMKEMNWLPLVVDSKCVFNQLQEGLNLFDAAQNNPLSQQRIAGKSWSLLKCLEYRAFPADSVNIDEMILRNGVSVLGLQYITNVLASASYAPDGTIIGVDLQGLPFDLLYWLIRYGLNTNAADPALRANKELLLDNLVICFIQRLGSPQDNLEQIPQINNSFFWLEAKATSFPQDIELKPISYSLQAENPAKNSTLVPQIFASLDWRYDEALDFLTRLTPQITNLLELALPTICRQRKQLSNQVLVAITKLCVTRPSHAEPTHHHSVARHLWSQLVKQLLARQVALAPETAGFLLFIHARSWPYQQVIRPTGEWLVSYPLATAQEKSVFFEKLQAIGINLIQSDIRYDREHQQYLIEITLQLPTTIQLPKAILASQQTVIVDDATREYLRQAVQDLLIKGGGYESEVRVELNNNSLQLCYASDPDLTDKQMKLEVARLQHELWQRTYEKLYLAKLALDCVTLNNNYSDLAQKTDFTKVQRAEIAFIIEKLDTLAMTINEQLIDPIKQIAHSDYWQTESELLSQFFKDCDRLAALQAEQQQAAKVQAQKRAEQAALKQVTIKVVPVLTDEERQARQAQLKARQEELAQKKRDEFNARKNAAGKKTAAKGLEQKPAADTAVRSGKVVVSVVDDPAVAVPVVAAPPPVVPRVLTAEEQQRAKEAEDQAFAAFAAAQRQSKAASQPTADSKLAILAALRTPPTVSVPRQQTTSRPGRNQQPTNKVSQLPITPVLPAQQVSRTTSIAHKSLSQQASALASTTSNTAVPLHLQKLPYCASALQERQAEAVPPAPIQRPHAAANLFGDFIDQLTELTRRQTPGENFSFFSTPWLQNARVEQKMLATAFAVALQGLEPEQLNTTKHKRS